MKIQAAACLTGEPRFAAQTAIFGGKNYVQRPDKTGDGG